MRTIPKLSVARPSDDLEAVIRFYWDRQGITFEDPDGYRVVLQRTDWTR